MKKYKFAPKPYVFIICITFICCVQISAQIDPVEKYLKEVGDFAEIYNGRIEQNYHSLLYENFPYYLSSDFTDASVIFKNKYYPNQKARLDLHKEHIIILPSEKRYGIIINSQDVDRVNMYGRTLKYFDAQKEAGIKKGFYIILNEGEKTQLFCKEHYTLRQKQITFAFDLSIRYYLYHNNRFNVVKNKGSFTKLFPQYKKQINQYAKEHKQYFNQNTETSLTYLARYCEELLTSTNNK